MTEREIKEHLDALHEFKKKVTASKQASKKFLVELGVVTPEGKLGQHYQHLCIQSDRT